MNSYSVTQAQSRLLNFECVHFIYVVIVTLFAYLQEIYIILHLNLLFYMYAIQNFCILCSSSSLCLGSCKLSW